jgi:hypothetical protein
MAWQDSYREDPVPEKHFSALGQPDGGGPVVRLTLMFRSGAVLYAWMPVANAREQLTGFASGRWEREAEEGYDTVTFLDADGNPQLAFRFAEVLAVTIDNISPPTA